MFKSRGIDIDGTRAHLILELTASFLDLNQADMIILLPCALHADSQPYAYNSKTADWEPMSISPSGLLSCHEERWKRC